ncbi:MAG: DUF2840 domain-containing protein [Parvibaculum sp.]
MRDLLTIREVFAEGQRNMRIMAGVFSEGPELENLPGFRRRLFYAQPHEIILFERWMGNAHGTTLSEMIAFRGGEGGFIPEVDRPVEILMYLRTWPVTKHFYPVYDAIRDAGVWTLLTPTWWRICGARLAARQPAPPLDLAYLRQCADLHASKSPA